MSDERAMRCSPVTSDYKELDVEIVKTRKDWIIEIQAEVARLTAQRDRLRREIQLLTAELVGIERGGEEPLEPNDMTD